MKTYPRMINNMTSNDVQTVWNKCMEILESRIDRVDYDQLFSAIKPLNLSYREGRYELIIVLPCPGETFRKWFDARFCDDLGAALNTVFEDKKVVMFYDTQSPKPSSPAAMRPSNEASLQNGFKGVNWDFNRSRPKDIYFDSFVVGANNEVAFGISKEVCHSVLQDKSSFSPLYIYGNVGLGKTHLACAVANEIKKHRPEKNIFYSQLSEFVSLFTRSVKEKTVSDFISVFDKVNVLIIDDIQHIADKRATQQIFFQIFEKIHSRYKGSQIIITSDVSPGELKDIDERLISRLKWGVSVQLDYPNAETRKKILQSKIQSRIEDTERDIAIKSELIDLIAHEMGECSIRDLEGAINKVLAEAISQSRDPDEGLVHRAILDVATLKEQREVSVDVILKTTCEYLNVDAKDIVSKNKTRNLVEARQIAMYLCARLTKSSLKQIGRLFGKDHSTVIYSRNTIKSSMQIYSDLRKKVEDIERILMR